MWVGNPLKPTTMEPDGGIVIGGKRVYQVFGGSIPAPIWKTAMTGALAGAQKISFTAPPDGAIPPQVDQHAATPDPGKPDQNQNKPGDNKPGKPRGNRTRRRSRPPRPSRASRSCRATRGRRRRTPPRAGDPRPPEARPWPRAGGGGAERRKRRWEESHRRFLVRGRRVLHGPRGRHALSCRAAP
ncbi:hypothetical protein ACU686_02495 [Yinghuangia aomiensis]